MQTILLHLKVLLSYPVESNFINWYCKLIIPKYHTYYLLFPTLVHELDGSSCFSITYSVIKLPPSSSGGFHDKVQVSEPMFSTTGNLGGSGRSV